ncbi:hypothetical protein [Dyella tabacisoli]|uniref:hypothetical protein n=1 Tax=Dyella tabacisoli TaxID=2282381 RepID=UPI0013B44AEC|nr:hypothetical protein [Dyella tabacisoli]
MARRKKSKWQPTTTWKPTARRADVFLQPLPTPLGESAVDPAPSIDQFAVHSGYDIPRSKANASLSWVLHLGPLPNYASIGFIGASYLYNGSLQYKLNVSWSDAQDRSYFVQRTYKFGGAAL